MPGQVSSDRECIASRNSSACSQQERTETHGVGSALHLNTAGWLPLTQMKPLGCPRAGRIHHRDDALELLGGALLTPRAVAIHCEERAVFTAVMEELQDFGVRAAELGWAALKHFLLQAGPPCYLIGRLDQPTRETGYQRLAKGVWNLCRTVHPRAPARRGTVPALRNLLAGLCELRAAC